MSESECRKLSDLRVIDLRAELDKRGLDKNGVKATLLEKLSKALRDEGHDPDTYEFSDRTKRLSTTIKEEPDLDVKPSIEDLAVHVPITDVTVKEEPENVPEKKVSDESEEEEEENAGVDTDFSLNLTIEEDEEDQLLFDVDEKPVIKEEGKTDEVKLASVIDEDPLSLDEMEEVDTTAETSVKTQQEEDGTVSELERSKGADDDDTAAPEVMDAEPIEDVPQAVEQEDNDEKTTTTVDATAVPETTANLEDGTSLKTNTAAPDSVAETSTKKPDKDTDSNGTLTGRSLWVAGLANKTRATDLKHLLSKYGKVIGAKVVTNARTPSARCYGYVVMATAADADNCIKWCHRTELHGRFICIDRARGDKNENSVNKSKATPVKKSDEKDKSDKASGAKTDKQSAGGDDKTASERDKSNQSVTDNISQSKSNKSSEENQKDKKISDVKVRKVSKTRSETSSRAGRERTRDKDRQQYRERREMKKSPERGRRDVLTFKQILEERERQRAREREREIREAEQRRSREEQARVRELERKNKEEAHRLERERDRLRIEREKLQREKAELIRLERKRLEHERMELVKQQMKLEESRRAPKRVSTDRRVPYSEEKKRITSVSRFESPPGQPSMHFDIPIRNTVDPIKKHEMYKRDEYKPGRGDEYKSRDIDPRPRGGGDDRGGVRDEYKGRGELRVQREEMRGREELRGRNEYSKRDRGPDFAPPPPRLSGRSSLTKYNAPPDSPPYSGGGRPRELIRRAPMSPAPGRGSSANSGGNGSGGGNGGGGMMAKDMRYADHSGPSGVRSPENSSGSYRIRDDRSDRRSENDHHRGKGDLRSRDHRSYGDMPMKDYPNRDSVVWHSGSPSMKQFPTSSMSSSLLSGTSREPWMKKDSPLVWTSSGNRGMDSGSTSGRWLQMTPSGIITGGPLDTMLAMKGATGGSGGLSPSRVSYPGFSPDGVDRNF